MSFKRLKQIWWIKWTDRSNSVLNSSEECNLLCITASICSCSTTLWVWRIIRTILCSKENPWLIVSSPKRTSFHSLFYFGLAKKLAKLCKGNLLNWLRIFGRRIICNLENDRKHAYLLVGLYWDGVQVIRRNAGTPALATFSSSRISIILTMLFHLGQLRSINARNPLNQGSRLVLHRRRHSRLNLRISDLQQLTPSRRAQQCSQTNT
jgi:hypothetical protein